MKMGILKEPLLHFLVIGAALFILGDLFGGAVSEDRRIDVTREQVEWLRSTWEGGYGRPPTEEEMNGLIRDFVQEEILYREAVAMGLAEDDPIIKRRLATKVQFLFDEVAETQEVTDAEIRSWVDENIDRYSSPARLSFEQVFFNTEIRGDEADGAVREALTLLRVREVSPEDRREMGDEFAVLSEFGTWTAKELRRVFGPEFADAVFALEAGSWEGPIRSSYGAHAVRVLSRIESEPPLFDRIRGQARADLLAERQRRATIGVFERLLDKYDIYVDGEPMETGGGAETGTRQINES